jgi:Flp pilus assembly protein TadD
MKINQLRTIAICLTVLASVARASGDDSNREKLITEGETLIRQQKPKDAIDTCLNPIIEEFSSITSTNPARIYCARDSQETLLYLLCVSAADGSDKGKTPITAFYGDRFAEKKNGGAAVLPQFWAEAYYLKAYALIDMGNTADAKKCLETAIGLSPLNSKYLSELGHIYQMEQDWNTALQIFHEAGSEALRCSHPDQKTSDQTRAWRGEGYSLIELGRLDEAKEKYRQCLQLNPDDARASNELKYIANLEAKKGQETGLKSN